MKEISFTGGKFLSEEANFYHRKGIPVRKEVSVEGNKFIIQVDKSYCRKGISLTGMKFI